MIGEAKTEEFLRYLKGELGNGQFNKVVGPYETIRVFPMGDDGPVLIETYNTGKRGIALKICLTGECGGHRLRINSMEYGADGSVDPPLVDATASSQFVDSYRSFISPK